MYLNNEKEKLSIGVFNYEEYLHQLIEKFKEEKIKVPDVILATFKVDEDVVKKLNIIGVKYVFHIMKESTLKYIRLQLLAQIIDETETDIDHKFEELIDNFHSGVKNIREYFKDKLDISNQFMKSIEKRGE